MTTQPTVPETMTRQATVSEASQVTGRNGETQWALKLEIRDISQFPVPCFMALDRASQVLKGSTHLVTMRRGKVKANKEGKYPSDYFWDLTGWDVKPPAPAPSQRPQERTDGASAPWDGADTQSRISWAQAVNLAVEAVGLVKDPDVDPLKVIENWANRFYPLIRKGPTPQEEPLFPEGGDDPRDLPDEEYEEHVEPDGHGGADVVREPVAPAKKPAKTPWQGFRRRGEREPAVSYYLSMAKEHYGKDMDVAMAALGQTWPQWLETHMKATVAETERAAIQAAILRLVE